MKKCHSCIKLDQFSYVTFFFFFFFTDNFVTHKLPTVSYRHYALSTVEAHKHPGFSTNHAQWSSTFLKLHVTELPVTRLHDSALNG